MEDNKNINSEEKAVEKDSSNEHSEHHHGHHSHHHHHHHHHKRSKKSKFLSFLKKKRNIITITAVAICLVALVLLFVLEGRFSSKPVDKYNPNDNSADINDDVSVDFSVNGAFAPSPQLPADGSETADFNANRDVIVAEDIYEYLDELVQKYPNYVTKECLGKDASGTYDWNRYVCSTSYYKAYQREGYTKMYAWVCDGTTVYSTSVSPRIGDCVYSSRYQGKAYGRVTEVDNLNQTRTINGLSFKRGKEKDVEPTLVYVSTFYSPDYADIYQDAFMDIYDASGNTNGKFVSLENGKLVDKDGIVYTRYPLGDKNESFESIPVIVIGGNEHGTGGDHAAPAVIASRLVKDLCESEASGSSFINTLKNDYMMVICPIINPWGFSSPNQKYFNSNNVNLDRNFDTPGWGSEVNDDSGSQGAYGGSEIETQYFMNTLAESKAVIAMANHGVGSPDSVSNAGKEFNSAGQSHYMLGRNDSKYDTALKAIGAVMSANYNLTFTDYSEAPPEVYAKTRSYIEWIGAEGGAVEMQAVEGYYLKGNAKLFTPKIMEANYTLMLQVLNMFVTYQGT